MKPVLAHATPSWKIAAVIPGLLLTATLVSSCRNEGGEQSGSGPISPSSVPSSQLATELIRGIAADSAFRPIAGATLEIVDGPGAGLSTSSGTDGSFSFLVPGKIDDAMRIRVSKEGYVTASGAPQPDCAACNPRRWAFFYLELIETPVQIAGDYTLTFVADPACTNLPEELRRRTYSATVVPSNIGYPGFPHTATTSYRVSPRGSAFLDIDAGVYLNVAGNYINVAIGDHTDPGVAERIGPRTYFTFGGRAAVTVASPVASISTPFEGWIERCELASEIGARYDCGTTKALTAARCEAKHHQMILARVN